MITPELQERMKANEPAAARVRERLRQADVACVSMAGSSGSGKTTLVETALRAFRGLPRTAVIVGDPDAALDVARIAACGVPVVHVNRSGGCHLEAHHIETAIGSMDLFNLDLLLIENVTNLKCPCGFDLGETFRVSIFSAPEGLERTAYVQKLLRDIDLAVLNKVDMAERAGFDESFFFKVVERYNPGTPAIRVSCRTGLGLQDWFDWLRKAAGLMPNYANP